ncbi:MAG: hypothetical protein JKY31_05610 [Rhodobacteraceae bacterium]|nr:hypothetical protein [Paracoccaceae bacterium]
MGLGFRDELTSKVDLKGRVSIPAPFRSVLAEGDPECTTGKNPRVVLMHGMGGDECLTGYTVDAAKNIEEKILAMPYGRDRKKLLRRLAAKSIPLTVDDNGRIILRDDLTKKFNISGSAIFVGMVELFQIWNPEAYEIDSADLDADIDDSDTMELLNSVGLGG